MNKADLDFFKQLVRDKLAQAGFNPKASSAAELQTLTQTEYERFGKVAKAAAITVD